MPSLSVFLLVVASSAFQMSASREPVPSPAKEKAAVDPKLHSDAIRLVEVSEARKKVQESFPASLAQGKKTMMEHCPACKHEFGDEWEKRMLKRMNADDFTAVYVEEYEKFLTDSEIVELISLQDHSTDGPSAVASDALKAKLSSVLPSLMSEVMGRCTQIGAKAGAEVAADIGREHPDWVGAQPADKTPGK